jgi:class 3 adenylate cyclase/cold shock CspA family protein
MVQNNSTRPLRETFADPTSLQNGVIAFYDQRGSTAAKVSRSEAQWVTETAFVYDLIIQTAREHFPEVVWNVMGDGVVLFYPDPNAAVPAILTAIEVLEKMERASRPISGGGGSIDTQMSVGIGSGLMRWFEAPGGALNALGLVADRAARLCSLASPQALFIDASTPLAANFLQIESQYGRATGRTAEEYQGKEQKADLKGLPGSVSYYEVLWSKNLFGVKSEALSEKVAQHTGGASDSFPAGRGKAVSTSSGDKIVGAVKSKHDSFAFITAENSSEDFFVAPNLMVNREDFDTLRVGDKVAFVAVEASAAGKNRRAGATMVNGLFYEGSVASPTLGRTYGWVIAKDQLNNRRYLWASGRELGPFKPYEMVSFKLEINATGASAVELAELDESEEPPVAS